MKRKALFEVNKNYKFFGSHSCHTKISMISRYLFRNVALRFENIKNSGEFSSVYVHIFVCQRTAAGKVRTSTDNIGRNRSTSVNICNTHNVIEPVRHEI